MSAGIPIDALQAASALANRSSESLELEPPGELEAFTFKEGKDEYVIFAFPVAEIELPARLSRAERDIVHKVLEGATNAAIARSRGTSVRTVANQLQGIYAKLGVSGRSALIQCCLAGNRERESGPALL